MGSQSRWWCELSKINVKAGSAHYSTAVGVPYGNLKFGRNMTDMMHMKVPVHGDTGARYGVEWRVCQ